MARRQRSRFDRARRRQALTTWSFMRPQAREAESERLHERLQEMPELRREYRQSLALQLGIIGALVLSCVVLLVQSMLMIRSFEKVPAIAGLAWAVPAIVAAIGYLALRRFLRVLGEYRRLGGG
jgi:ABC-type Fe3+ transport system permease subunit